MAWFKKNDAQDGQLPHAVTIERVGAAFDRAGWKYDYADGRIITGFMGYSTLIRVMHEQLLVITVSYVDVPLPQDKGMELSSWADVRNQDSIVGTVQVHFDPEDNSFMVISDHTILVKAGATDEQLDAWVSLCIDGNLSHMDSLAQEFGVKPEFEED